MGTSWPLGPPARLMSHLADPEVDSKGMPGERVVQEVAPEGTRSSTHVPDSTPDSVSMVGSR